MDKSLIDHKKLSEILPDVGAGDKSSLHVVLLFGGISPEREPSLMSGNALCEAVKNLNYRVTPVDMGIDIAEVIRKLNPDVVFNALHGTYGEDGCIQGMLEILGIPYTHSGVLTSAIALDKIYSQEIFIAGGIKCPKRIIVNRGDDLTQEPISRPYVIKPVDQGSSLGVEVILLDDDYDLSKYSFAYGDKAIIEEYIPGLEIQVGVLNNRAIGTLEIICLQGKRFNDYDCKYKEGFSRHECPGNLSQSAQNQMMTLAEKAHKILGCKGVTRVEFRYNPETEQAYFLEINTHPGLTPLSSVPDILRHNGISLGELFTILINETLNDYKK